jgi:hypothetical protein
MNTTEQSITVYSCIVCGAPTKYNNGRCTPCYSKDTPKTEKKSEGEEYIGDFLTHFNIKFEEQKPIVGLKGDTKKYRIADFYLKDYKLYIEYNGRYLDNREHYDEKIKVYNKNKIPCVHLYPENLGVLHYILDKRIIHELKNRNLEPELKKYKLYKMKKGESHRIIIMGILLLTALYFAVDYNKGDRGILVILGLLLSFQAYKLFKAYQSIFKEEKYPFNRMES